MTNYDNALFDNDPIFDRDWDAESSLRSLRRFFSDPTRWISDTLISGDAASATTRDASFCIMGGVLAVMLEQMKGENAPFSALRARKGTSAQEQDAAPIITQVLYDGLVEFLVEREPQGADQDEGDGENWTARIEDEIGQEIGWLATSGKIARLDSAHNLRTSALISFNDAPQTNYDDIVAVIDKAVVLAKLDA